MCYMYVVIHRTRFRLKFEDGEWVKEIASKQGFLKTI